MLFELECLQEEVNFEQTQLIVKPNVMEICHYVDSREILLTVNITPTLINDFITEQTTLLFNAFQNNVDIPQEIKDNYTL
jgi:hypothetical protein